MMTAIKPTRLEKWLEHRMAPRKLSPETLAAFQLDHLNQTMAHVTANSPFYRRRLQDGPVLPLTDLSQLKDIPFITTDDLREHHLDMLCVSHGEVERVVTMQTSGTSAAPKRLYFSEADLEQTVDFFHYGMTCIAKPGEKVLIMLPGQTPYSVGDQLMRAVSRMPMTSWIHWPVLDLDNILEEIREKQIDCLVGAPSQVFALCRHEQTNRRLSPNPLKSILLSTDYIPQAVVDELRNAWQCRVFEHYGMTEMGLGAALHCDAHNGFHLREADLLFEIIDPESGVPLPPGVEGEVVVTTLTREAMPLIRYRTGDRAAWLEEPCPCGSFMRRLGKVSGRLADFSSSALPLTISELDEAILALPGIYSFQAVCRPEGNETALEINAFCRKENAERLKTEIPSAISAIAANRQSKPVSIRIHILPPEALRWDSTGMIKRSIG